MTLSHSKIKLTLNSDQNCLHHPLSLILHILFLMLNRSQLLNNKTKSSIIYTIDSDQYQIRNVLLGVGPYSQVFACWNTKIFKVFAAKVIDKQQLMQYWQSTGKREIMMDIFERSISNSIQMMQKLNHINILKLQTFIKTELKYYYILEYCNQNKISSILEQKTRFNLDIAQLIILQILQAFEYIHSLNICHRNVNSNNILIGSGSPKITGFGLAVKIVQFSDRNCSQESIDYMMDKRYVAPEILSLKKCELKSDVWSLGIVFYEMLYGVVPFPQMASAKTNISINYLKDKIQFDDNVQVPEKLKEGIRRMLNVNHHLRLSIGQAKQYFTSMYS